MFDLLLSSAAIGLTVIGIFFFLVGSIGVLRLPDFFCRTHAATKCDTLGMGAILIGLTVYERFSFDSLKILVLCALVLVSSPTAAHAISRAAYRRGLIPWCKTAPDTATEE